MEGTTGGKPPGIPLMRRPEGRRRKPLRLPDPARLPRPAVAVRLKTVPCRWTLLKPQMSGRSHLRLWWALLLLLAVACTSGAGEDEVSSTSPGSVTAAPPTSVTTTDAIPSTTTTTLPDDLTVVEVTVRDGRAVGENRVDVPLGNRISLRFNSDARLLVHVHGYDEEFSVEAGVVTVHEFEGDLPGIFEVEDHVTHRLLIELKVSS